MHVYVTNRAGQNLSSSILATFGIGLYQSSFTVYKIVAGSDTNSNAEAGWYNYGEAINLRIEAYETEDGKVLLKQFINCVEVASVTTAPSAASASYGITPKSLRFINTSSARNLEMTFTDTTYVEYKYFNDIPGTNAVIPSATQTPGTNVTASKTATLDGKTDDSESITLDSQTLKVGDAISKGHVT